MAEYSHQMSCHGTGCITGQWTQRRMKKSNIKGGFEFSSTPVVYTRLSTTLFETLTNAHTGCSFSSAESRAVAQVCSVAAVTNGASSSGSTVYRARRQLAK